MRANARLSFLGSALFALSAAASCSDDDGSGQQPSTAGSGGSAGATSAGGGGKSSGGASSGGTQSKGGSAGTMSAAGNDGLGGESGAIGNGGSGQGGAEGGAAGANGEAGAGGESCTLEGCQDDIFCNGEERCIPGVGCRPALTARDCSSADPCMITACDQQLDECVSRCDTAQAQCQCGGGPSCEGGFFFQQNTVLYTCATGLVNLNFNTVTFALDAGALTITTPSGMTGCSATGLSLTQPTASCPAFDATIVCPGACEETYRFQGVFLDDDTFQGAFSAAFEGTCLDCTDQVFVIVGGRQ